MCEFPIRNSHNRPPAPPPSARTDPDHFPSLPIVPTAFPLNPTTYRLHPHARIPRVSRPILCEFPIGNLHNRPPAPPPITRIAPDHSQSLPHHIHNLPTESQHLPPPFAQIPTPFRSIFPGRPIRKSCANTANHRHHHRFPAGTSNFLGTLVTFVLGHHRLAASPSTTPSW